MPTLFLVGMPVFIISVLGGIVIYERQTERSREKKRTGNLKRWLESQSSEQ